MAVAPGQKPRKLLSVLGLCAGLRVGGRRLARVRSIFLVLHWVRSVRSSACGLTIHSSRSRFAARLNSGVIRHRVEHPRCRSFGNISTAWRVGSGYRSLLFPQSARSSLRLARCSVWCSAWRSLRPHPAPWVLAKAQRPRQVIAFCHRSVRGCSGMGYRNRVPSPLPYNSSLNPKPLRGSGYLRR
jgi:hypothetical protein